MEASPLSVISVGKPQNAETENLPNQHSGSILLGFATLQISPVCLGTTFIHFKEGPLDRIGKHAEALASTMGCQSNGVGGVSGSKDESHN